ncbi:MAG: GTPase [Eubacterium sp.]|nr:GTPase [Eubacterium sp.]MCI8858483.1 GTPase [Lachnospiraceae bacterium]
MMEEIPVYLFTGFMDSGKTSLIRQTLLEDNFGEGAKTLLIACEDGDEEYGEAEMKRANTRLLMVENEEDFTETLLNNINLQYLPDQVFIEYNGTWGLDTILETALPEGWVIVQSLATVDATTFDLYLNNMRAMIMEQLFKADVVIINRCTLNTPKGKFRRAIKAVNRPAQIVYEREDGMIDESEEELPFDINQDIIEITDADYAIWYMDAQENYKKYDGKKIEFTGLVYNPDKMKKGVMVPGRFAMTCCIEDVTFLGFKCKYPDSKSIPHRSWIHIIAEIRVEFAVEYKGKGPVLYAISIEPAEKPEDELVYFS